MDILRNKVGSDVEHGKATIMDEEPSKYASRYGRASLHTPTPAPHDMQIGLACDPGRIRDRNEDASLAWQFLIAQHGLPAQPTGLYMVADGMGGHSHGAQASALALRLAAGHVVRNIGLPLLSEPDSTDERPPIHEVLRASFKIAHQALLHRYPGSGTTLTMALMLAEAVYITHVGDSRAYLGETGSIRLLTKDHTVAARLLEMGQASPEEAELQRNILYKAIGQGPDIEPDIVYHDFKEGQYLLICCDGLWGKVPDEEIAAIVERAPTPDIACQDLVASANEHGGDDNISAVLVARGWPLPPNQVPDLGDSKADVSRQGNGV